MVRTLRFGVPFLFLASAPLGFILGGAWSFLTVGLVPLALCGLDWILGLDREAPLPSAHARWLARLYLAAQLAVTGWAAVTVAGPDVGWPAALGLTLSVGMAAGVFGMVAAHEMVHSLEPGDRALGLTMLASVVYMHFRIAHIQGHHLRAATRDDPASARAGESAYAFILRSVVGQAREAWAFETARLRRRGRSRFGPANRMVSYLAAEATVGLAALWVSPWSLAFVAGQAVLAVILLELFNYIAHYGLERRALTAPACRPRRRARALSWSRRGA